MRCAVLLAAVAGVIIAARTASVKSDYGNSYLLIAILITVMAGVRPQGGYGRMVCLFFSAVALQLLSSTFNLLGISNFFRDCAWGLLLLFFLASARFSLSDLRASFPFRAPAHRRTSPLLARRKEPPRARRQDMLKKTRIACTVLALPPWPSPRRCTRRASRKTSSPW
jgi:hypothetical protein